MGFPARQHPLHLSWFCLEPVRCFLLADVMEFKLDWNWIIYTYIHSKLQVHVTTTTTASWKPSQSHKQHFYTFLSKSDSLSWPYVPGIFVDSLCMPLLYQIVDFWIRSRRAARRRPGRPRSFKKPLCDTQALIDFEVFTARAHPTSMIGDGWK